MAKPPSILEAPCPMEGCDQMLQFSVLSRRPAGEGMDEIRVRLTDESSEHIHKHAEEVQLARPDSSREGDTP